MPTPENTRRFPIIEARDAIGKLLKGPLYDGEGLRGAFGRYEEAMHAVIPDRVRSSRQLLSMAQALEVCTRIRSDDSSVDFFRAKQLDYLNQMDVPVNKNPQEL